MKIFNTTAFVICAAFMVSACTPKQKSFEMGSYGYDVKFLSDNSIEYLELSSEDGQARVMLVPGWQGRVMTSTASGDDGDSYGWINYELISSVQVNHQFNPYGGEERFWFGPEGGPFSLYFAQDAEQVYENWRVPAVIDTEGYDVSAVSDASVTFTKNTVLTNASGTRFDIDIDRTVSLMSDNDIEKDLGFVVSQQMKVVAYQSVNTITNIGERAWSKETGLPSVWLLGMFNPTPTTTVFIPYNEQGEGIIVNDEYFGKIPADRLIVENGMIYFKIDGLHRSKLGIPRSRVKELCGSYDSSKGVLTLLWCSLPDGPVDYVNGQWGPQDDPYNGDVINSYNDGPTEDGTVMGPFYEIETSSPGAALAPGQSLTHRQKVIHIQAAPQAIDPIVNKLFGVKLEDIVLKFQ